jgi:toxin YoeB
MARGVMFAPRGWEEFLEWHERNGKLFAHLNALINECRRTPFTGSGKPEPLKHEWKGFWSRRLDHEHRLIYAATDKDILVARCKGHY